jgi:aspartate carbamoyltransferase catalytic subunit
MNRSHDPAIQYDGQGRLRHLLTLEGMPGDTIRAMLEGAQAMQQGQTAPGGRPGILANLFFEPSTRTRCSFEIAAGRLGWQVININEACSSLVKGETLADTARTLAAMGVTACTVRHSDPAAAWTVARSAPADMSVINAGGGSEDHPTQGLLDALTVQQHKDRVQGLTISICGDVRHSRVHARTSRPSARWGLAAFAWWARRSYCPGRPRITASWLRISKPVSGTPTSSSCCASRPNA